MTKILAEIELDLSPETVEHAQIVLDNDTKFRPYSILVKDVVE